MENNRCVVCERTLRGHRRHVLNEHFIQRRPDFREHIPQEIQFNGTRSMCNACWHSIDRRLNEVQPPDGPLLAFEIATENNCLSCQHSIRRRRKHILNIETLQLHRNIVEYLLRYIQPPQEVPLDGSRAVCHACWCRIIATINAASPPVAVLPNSITVAGLSRAANTSRRCMIMHCNNQHLRTLSNSTKVYLLSYYHLYVPKLARICQQHLQTMSTEELSRNIVDHESDINAESVLDIINIYTSVLERRSSIDLEEMSDEEFRFWLGISREQFNILLNQVPTLHDRSKSPKIDLAVYLCKLRNGEPNNRIGSLFNCSKHTIGRKICLVRSCLTNDFVPLHMGLDHITRDEIIERNRILPNYIFGNDDNPKAIIILDGTYLFTEKSTNFLFQRVSYSLHKYRNLIKPFMIFCGDGHIIDIIGPYAATTNDADILKMILNNHGEPIEDCVWHYFFHQNDVMVLDRGFRDAIPQAEEYGYEVHMPASNRRGQRQLSTEDSNKSRLVTICRWVVEAINGRIKRDFKLFRNRVFNRDLPHIFDDFKIAGAIINCFQEPFEDSAYTDEFCQIIRQNIHKPNLLADYIEENNLNQQRVPFVRLEATIEEY